MQTYLWIAFGSALGGVGRYWCSGLVAGGFAGATVLRGPMGFGQSSRLHTAKIMRLSEDLPVVVEIVDAEDRVQDLLAAIEPLLGSALVTLERVQVLRYGAPES